MPPRRRLTAAAEPTRTSPDLRASVEAAITAMGWLAPSDLAMADLARSLADKIEQAHERADSLAQLFGDIGGDPGLFKRLQKLEAMCDVTKTVGWLGPQLQGVLRDLGGAPSARKAMQADQPVGSRLAQIRASATGRRSATSRTNTAAAVDST